MEKVWRLEVPTSLQRSGCFDELRCFRESSKPRRSSLGVDDLFPSDFVISRRHTFVSRRNLLSGLNCDHCKGQIRYCVLYFRCSGKFAQIIFPILNPFYSLQVGLPRAVFAQGWNAMSSPKNHTEDRHKQYQDAQIGRFLPRFSASDPTLDCSLCHAYGEENLWHPALWDIWRR